MSERFQITGPGFYRQRNGGKAEVFAYRNGRWFGVADCMSSASWNSHGERGEFAARLDIVAVWNELPEPPAGFRLMPKDYVANAEDIVWWGGRWYGHLTGHLLSSAISLDTSHQLFAPHYIASPIPKPFAISDHGPGIYETRDGGQEVVWKRNEFGTWEDSRGSPQWHDDGHTRSANEFSQNDLVRYLGPLPSEEPWTPTCELRWTPCGVSDIHSIQWIRRSAKNWGYARLEQKWTRGMEHEWRAV